MVRKVGVEPTRYYYHQILSLERMPISPLSLFKKENRKAWYILSFAHCKDKGFSKNYRTSRCSCFYFYCNETFVVNMAPRAGLEPATTWLTVRCSTDWAIEECNWRFPILPGRLQPSTFGVYVLNYCVRNGNRWNHIANITGLFNCTDVQSKLHRNNPRH